MKPHMDIRHAARSLLCTAFFISLALPLPALPASLSLATAPLTSSTTTTVAPNLMFIIDSSGSMAWNYLPDWANDSLCKRTTGTYDAACDGQPPFRSPDFNGVYYNPAINYVPAVNADGTSKGSQASPWTSVKNDAYNIQNTGSTNLVTGYPDTEWCTDSTYTDCLRNDNYILPGIMVAGKTYATSHTTTSSGSGSVATGSLGSPTTASRSWGPHYYMMVPGEYCNSARLTNCQTTQTSDFSYPARLRWCSDTAMTTCQANRTSTYNIPRFPTKVTRAVATITVGSGNSSTTVSSITVNGQQILSATTTGSSTSSNVATDIATKINACTLALSGNCTVAGYS
ncbi:MAG TPA: hypothetical protein VGO07_00630, partial [Candidatus Saccharimonadales bacterium]|nr:hypothetical protein [Candidatus Saccharimonadales bacterium]